MDHVIQHVFIVPFPISRHSNLTSWVPPLATMTFVPLSLRNDGCQLANFCHWECASFCKLAHLVRCIPPTSAMLELLANFDNDVLHCLEQCTELQLSPMASQQAQLSFRHGGFGLCSLFSHATAAYIASASISLSGAFPPTTVFTHLQTAIAMFNQQVTDGEALTMVSVLLSPPRQHLLSEKVEKLALSSLLHNATTATKA